MDKRTVRRIIIAICILLCIAAVSGYGTEIYLRSRVLSSSGVVRLGDVAVISADGGLADRLRAVPLAVFSSNQSGMVLEHGLIRQSIESRGIIQFMLIGSRVVVNRVQVQPDRQDAILRLKRHFRAKFPQARFKLQVQFSGEIPVLYAASYAISWKFTATPVVDGKWRQGRMLINGENGNRLTVGFRYCITPIMLVAVVLRPLKQGEPVLRGGYRWTTVPADKVPSDPVSSDRQLRGTTAAVDLPAGTILTPEKLRFPVTVRRGQLVEVVYKNSGIEIIAPATAEQSGRPGEVIRLRAVQSGRIIQARITVNGRIRLQGGRT